MRIAANTRMRMAPRTRFPGTLEWRVFDESAGGAGRGGSADTEGGADRPGDAGLAATPPM
jgi:hypothetical protein